MGNQFEIEGIGCFLGRIYAIICILCRCLYLCIVCVCAMFH